MPAAQAHPNDSLDTRGVCRRILKGTTQPEHAIAWPLPAEKVLRALDTEARQRPLGVVERLLLVASKADLREPGFDLSSQGERARVTILGPQRHRLQADQLQRLIHRAAQPSRCGKDSS